MFVLVDIGRALVAVVGVGGGVGIGARVFFAMDPGGLGSLPYINWRI
jgi:hypothetical protein